jgi:hypothetical protein
MNGNVNGPLEGQILPTLRRAIERVGPLGRFMGDRRATQGPVLA